MSRIIISLSLVCLITACKEETATQPLNETAEEEQVSIEIEQQVESRYYSYYPDTNMAFSSSKELFDYINPLMSSLNNIKNVEGKTLGHDFSDTAVYVKEKANTLVSILLFKHAKKWIESKDGLVALLPHSNHFTDEKLKLLEEFPAELRNSELGKQVKKELESRIYNKYTGKDFIGLSTARLINLSNEPLQFSDVLMPLSSNTLVVFGASWCAPCKIQERRLKKYYDRVDTSSLNIIGIYIDKSQDKFVKYIHDENYPWKSFRIEGEENNPFHKTLGFSGVPMNFLLNSDGKVIKADLSVFDVLSYLGIEIPKM